MYPTDFYSTTGSIFSLSPFGLLHSSSQFSVSVTWQKTTHHRAGAA